MRNPININGCCFYEQAIILPCPFCGSVAEFEYDDFNPDTGAGDDGIGQLRCTNQKCGAGFHDYQDQAYEKWNRRTKQ